MESAYFPAFERHGPASTMRPVVLSVPHAGRDYPGDLARLTHFGPPDLMILEDRFADLLVSQCTASGFVTLIARTPRALIDLNRREDDLDLHMLDTAKSGQPSQHHMSAKARGGLGLIPRRTSHTGEIWHSPLTSTELNARIAEVHRPFHAELDQALDSAQKIFGQSLLLDIHSMPPLSKRGMPDQPDIVIGDRFGKSASARFANCVVAAGERSGFKVAMNVPYAGGYILERHGMPGAGRHALQIEIDRLLYLDAPMKAPGSGLARLQAFVLEMAVAAAEEITAFPVPLAAE